MEEAHRSLLDLRSFSSVVDGEGVQAAKYLQFTVVI
jgi:hypothetical protein